MPPEPSKVDGAAMVGKTRGFDVGQNDIVFIEALADGSLNALNTAAKKGACSAHKSLISITRTCILIPLDQEL